VNGQRLAIYDRPGAEPAVLFVHATGFHGRCWSQIMGRIPERRSIAVDLRGHGLSSKPESDYTWSVFGNDVAALARGLGLRGVTAVGHSMGGHSITLAATLVPEAFSELILVDPVILRPEAYHGRRWDPHFARKRRDRWASADEMFNRFKDRQPFVQWDVDVLRDYCDYGLVPATDGDGYVLACSPAVEGSIYEASALDDANLYDRLGTIDIPVTIVRAHRPMDTHPAMDMGASPTAPDLVAHFRHGMDIQTQLSHFIPMEAPAMLADLIRGHHIVT